MRHHIQYWFIIAMLTTGTSKPVHAQSEHSPVFLGINPSVTIEPFYQKGELDINVLPLVFQKPLNRFFDIRINSICNLGIRQSGNQVSHFGIEAALPIFFKSKKSKGECSMGFFAAPVLSATRNRMEKHNNLGLWLEPGYHLLFDNKLAMSFGLQMGATYFSYDNRQTKWGQHFGVKIILGKWLSRKS